jgi:fumarylacetoacetase
VVVVASHVTPSWLPVPAGSPFPITSLPYGVFSTAESPQRRRIGVALGELVIDAGVLAQGLPYAASLRESTLNAFMAAGPATWRDFRQRLTTWLTDESFRPHVEPALVALDEASLRMPFDPADYVDFYASEQHATNLGRLLRPGQPPLLPNWKHLPVGYHGRAGSLRVSGTTVTRPCGQIVASSGMPPSLEPTRKLDFEAEVGFGVGAGSSLGTRVKVGDFAEHVFGVCLVNDWSARDIQAWEYAPLGPLLGKSFLTSVSPWIVPLEALESARVVPPERDPQVLPYLSDTGCPWGLDIELEISLNGRRISRPPFRDMYWTASQQLAHLTVNGGALRTGDLLASGTVSGREREQFGSLIELSWNGERPLVLADGSTRTFLEDGDEVVITATAPGIDGPPIGLGTVSGQISPFALIQP